MGCTAQPVALKPAQMVDFGAVKMFYRGNGSAQIRGRVTGQIYQFARHEPVQAVDPRDAVGLISTRLFTPVL
jgi:hypothetical protein